MGQKPKRHYRIPISTSVFNHYRELRDALWLLLVFINWTTREIANADGSRDGLVLGGKPIRDEDTAKELGCSLETTGRWRKRLVKHGYIGQKRAPVGYVIVVKNSDKWPKRPVRNDRSDQSRITDHLQSEQANLTPDRAEMPAQNRQKCPIQLRQHTDNIKDNTLAMASADADVLARGQEPVRESEQTQDGLDLSTPVGTWVRREFRRTTGKALRVSKRNREAISQAEEKHGPDRLRQAFLTMLENLADSGRASEIGDPVSYFLADGHLSDLLYISQAKSCEGEPETEAAIRARMEADIAFQIANDLDPMTKLAKQKLQNETEGDERIRRLLEGDL